MDIAIVSALKEERDRLDRAIEALRGVTSNGRKRSITDRKRRGISAAGKARIAAAQRARWAKQRKKAA